MNHEKIEDTIEAWETGELGRSAEHAIPVSAEEQGRLEAFVEAAFGLKPISIRMEVEALDALKKIARHRSVGYQPLIRQILHRWIESELKQIALESISADANEVKVDRKAA